MAEPTNRRDFRDYLVVLQPCKRVDVQATVGNRSRSIDYVFSFARRELQRANIPNSQAGQTLSVERVNTVLTNRMSPAEHLRQPAPHGRRPFQIHLLRADATD